MCFDVTAQPDTRSDHVSFRKWRINNEKHEQSVRNTNGDDGTCCCLCNLRRDEHISSDVSLHRDAILVDNLGGGDGELNVLVLSSVVLYYLHIIPQAELIVFVN